MDLKGENPEDVARVNLVQKRIKWLAIVNMVMKLRFFNWTNSFTASDSVSFCCRELFNWLFDLKLYLKTQRNKRWFQQGYLLLRLSKHSLTFWLVRVVATSPWQKKNMVLICRTYIYSIFAISVKKYYPCNREWCGCVAGTEYGFILHGDGLGKYLLPQQLWNVYRRNVAQLQMHWLL